MLVVCAVLLVAGTAAAQKGPYGDINYWVWGSGANIPYGQNAAGAWVWSNANAPGYSIQVVNNYGTAQSGWSVAGTVWYEDINGNLLNGTGGTVFFTNNVAGSIPAHGYGQCNGGSDPNPPANWYKGSITLDLYNGPNGTGNHLYGIGGSFIYYNNGNGSLGGVPNP